MSLLHDVIRDVFGTEVSGASVVASGILVFLGAALNFLVELSQRDIGSTRTPEQFSFRFMLRDNWLRIGISFLFCIVAVITGPALIDMLETGWKIPETYSRFGSILLGWGSDYLPMRIKQRFFKSDISTNG